LYASPNNMEGPQIKEGEISESCSTRGEMISTYKTLVGKPEGKRSLGRPRRRWEDHVRMDLRKIRWKGVDWIHMDQGSDQRPALVNTVINFLVP